MTDCRDVKHAIMEDAITDDIRLHLDACEPCTELSQSPRLTTALAADLVPQDPGPDVSQMFAELSAQIDTEQNLVGWLRSRPTWMRRAFALLTFVGVALFGVVFVPRSDFAEYPHVRMAVSIVLLGGLLFFSLMYSLRPLHRQPLSPAGIVTGLVAAIGLSFGLALLPNPYQTDPALLPPNEVWFRALRCLYIGTLLGLPVYVMSRLFDRSRDPSHALFGAAAAGLTGQFVLLLHCPITNPTHLFFGHATVAVLFLSLVGGILRFDRRRHAH